MSVTALSVCLQPQHRRWSGIESAELSGRRFASAADVQAAWFDAVALVRTEWFLYVDDTDDLTSKHADTFARACDTAADLAWLGELVEGDDGEVAHRPARAYSRAEHAARPLLLHHGVLLRTAAARAAIASLPRGHYWPELLLFWQLARGGVHVLPEPCYLWRRAATGLHRAWFTLLGIERSRQWCAAHP